MKEAHLYAPIQKFFSEQGYVVQGEVKGVDMALRREEELILVELKLRFNLELVYQAVDRQTISDLVFVAVPRSSVDPMSTRYKSMMQLITRLDLGLLLVALDSPLELVEIVRLPSHVNKQTKKGARRKQQIENELDNRVFNLAVGGISGEKIPTAYREEAIKILCALEQIGQSSAATLHKEYGCSERSLAIISRNHYRWFLKIERGVYSLSDVGLDFFSCGKDFREIIDFYSKEIKQILHEQKTTKKE